MVLLSLCVPADQEQSLADLLAAAKQLKTGPMELCERIIEGEELPEGIKPGMKRNMAHFVGVVKKLRRAANEVSAKDPCLQT